jgi:signal transduction histidine kinase
LRSRRLLPHRARRTVDDGEDFEGDARGDGQGLRNIRARIGSIGAALALHTSPETGTALEVTLRM